MYNGKTISLKHILWKVLNHPLAAELSYDQAAEFAVEAIDLIGAPLGYIDKVSEPLVQINKYKGAMPLDYVQIRGARRIQNLDNFNRHAIPLTHTTNLYNKSEKCSEQSIDDCETIQEFTFKVENGVMFTSFEEGQVEVAYKALPVDDDGYPLIADNPKYKLAIEYYILCRYIEPLYDIGKITDKAYNRICQNKDWYIAGAQSSMQLASIPHLESTMNAINRLIVNDQAYKNFYKFFGQQERIRKYS